MLALAAGVVAMLGYARVDLGMSWAHINAYIETWIHSLTTFSALIWSQILVAALSFAAWKTLRR